jgi:hypothetical protein
MRAASTKSFYKAISVIIIIKYRPLFNAATDDMMQRTGSVDSGFPWHASIIADSKPK